MVLKRIKKRLPHNGARVKAFYHGMRIKGKVMSETKHKREMAKLDQQIKRAEKQSQLAAKQAKLAKLRAKTKGASRIGGWQASMRKYGGGFTSVADEFTGRGRAAPRGRKKKKKRKRRTYDDDNVGFDINDVL